MMRDAHHPDSTMGPQLDADGRGPADVWREVMDMQRVLLIFILVASLLSAARPAGAQDYLQCQGNETCAEGESSLESWNDIAAGQLRQDMCGKYGVSDRFQVSLFGSMEDPLDQRLFKGRRVETLYRLVDSDRSPLAVGVFLAHEQPGGFGPGQTLGRLVLSRELGEVNLTLNYGVGRSTDPGSGWQAEYGLAASAPLGSNCSGTVEVMKTADGVRAVIGGLSLKLSETLQAKAGVAATSESGRLQPYFGLSVRY
jgi:hypothetical protein